MPLLAEILQPARQKAVHPQTVLKHRGRRRKRTEHLPQMPPGMAMQRFGHMRIGIHAQLRRGRPLPGMRVDKIVGDARPDDRPRWKCNAPVSGPAARTVAPADDNFPHTAPSGTQSARAEGSVGGVKRSSESAAPWAASSVRHRQNMVRSIPKREKILLAISSIDTCVVLRLEMPAWRISLSACSSSQRHCLSVAY
jgi:hypothetical protein